MKKIISVLLLALTLSLFSSCIIVADPDALNQSPTYCFYFKNDRNIDIRDFYLEDRKGNVYSKGNGVDAYGCEAGETLVIKNLERKDYKLFYQYGYETLTEFGWFTMDSDKTFVLSEKTLYKGKLD